MPNGFTISVIEVKFYGLIIALGFIIGLFLVAFFAKRKGYKKDLPYDLVIIVFPLSIIGSRLYYILFSGRAWTFSEMFALQNGGLAIYGGVIGGFIALYIYGKVKKIDTIKLTDLVVPALILGQVLGRWGNFFNQEAFGPLVTDINLQWFPYAVFIDAEGAWHMATFFYESMWNLIGFVMIILIFLKTDKKGFITSFYLVYYGIGRFLIEGLRTDSLYIGDTSLRVSQVLSIVLVLFGVALFVYYYKKQKAIKN
ncbi:MAG: prolipoprotein diacylglyceryl transferase [Clostridia bacterium]|nr:prolipoprotein diacylglyceryl transferase [Clostridia bacterium]